jgi:hypothetical protein
MIRPMLAPGSDVRALTVPFLKKTALQVKLSCAKRALNDKREALNAKF